MLYLSKEMRPTDLDAGAILGRSVGRTRERASGKRELRKGDSDKWGGKFPSGANGPGGERKKGKGVSCPSFVPRIDADERTTFKIGHANSPPQLSRLPLPFRNNRMQLKLTNKVDWNQSIDDAFVCFIRHSVRRRAAAINMYVRLSFASLDHRDRDLCSRKHRTS